MKPTIQSTKFGMIKIAGEKYRHDVVIGLDGAVRKREKKLSKVLYGTSHILSLDEAKNVYESGAEQLLIGTGQTGYVTLSEEAAVFFEAAGCQVQLLPTPQAIDAWNQAQGETLGLFHITC